MHLNIRAKNQSTNTFGAKIQIRIFSESCCDELTLETWGMADFYQGERLGKYSKVGTSSDGRFVFKQDGGDNYLYYLSQNGVSL